MKRRWRALFLGPDKRFGPVIVSTDERIDVLLELLNGGEGCSAARLALQDGEPYLDLIEPRGSCRREMEAHLGVLLEPMPVLLVGVEVIHDDVKLAAPKDGNDAVREAGELNAPPFRITTQVLWKAGTRWHKSVFGYATAPSSHA